MSRTSPDKHMTRAEKKRAKYKERQKAKSIQRQLNTSRGYVLPDNIVCHGLDTPETDHLRWYKPGYNGAKGQLNSLHTGMTMSDALENTRNEWFSNHTWDHMLACLRTVATDPDMLDREREFAAKAGPYYLRDFSHWYSKAYEIFTPPKSDIADKVPKLVTCLHRIRDEYRSIITGMGFESGRITTAPMDQVVSKLKIKSNCGWPFFLTKWETQIDDDGISVLEWYIREADYCISSGDYQSLLDAPYVMLTRKMYRGTVDKEDLKMSERAVQCSSAIERLIGGGVQQPLLRVQRSHQFSQGHAGVWAMGKPIKEFFAHYDNAFEADYSGFDASIRHDLMRLIFDEVLIPIFDDRDRPRLEALRDHYSTASLWTPLGLITSDTVGLMSGSILTNAIGTIYGHMAWYYFVLRLSEEGVELENAALGYGDDLAVWFNKPPVWDSPRDIIGHFTRITREIDLIAHKEKQGVWFGDTKQVSFLGCVYFPHRLDAHGNCAPVYPIMRLASKLIWNEHQNLGSSGELIIRYSSGDIGYHEKLIAAMVGRCDVAQYNTCHAYLAALLYLQTGITPYVCQRFLPDYTVSPTLVKIQYLIDSGIQPQVVDPIVTKVTKMLDEWEQSSRNDMDIEVNGPTKELTDDSTSDWEEVR